MRTEYLEYLISLQFGQTISAASEKLHITPQGLSSAIASLEKELNCILLVRTKKGVYLTEAGNVLVKCAASFLQCVDQIKARQDELEGELVIPSTVGSIHFFLAEKLSKFEKENRKVKITFANISRQDCLLALDEHRAELAFTSSIVVNGEKSPQTRKLEQNTAFSYTPCVTFRGGIECHKDMLKSSVNAVDMHCLEGKTLIYNMSPENDCDTLWLLEKLGIANVNILYEPNATMYYQMLLNKIGYGCGLFSDRINFYAANLLVQKALINDIRISFGFIAPAGCAHSDLVRRLIDFITY